MLLLCSPNTHTLPPAPYQVTAVDKTPATTMCALGLGDSVARQWGPRVAAERVLPVLCPLLVVPSLNTQQFQTAMKTIRELLARCAVLCLLRTA